MMNEYEFISFGFGALSFSHTFSFSENTWLLSALLLILPPSYGPSHCFGFNDLKIILKYSRTPSHFTQIKLIAYGFDFVLILSILN